MPIILLLIVASRAAGCTFKEEFPQSVIFPRTTPAQVNRSHSEENRVPFLETAGGFPK